MYADQKKRSIKRNHPLPDYTKKQFKEWLVSQSNFERIYNDWINSNYETKLKPSVDRKESNLYYTFNNIQLMTWLENNEKGKSEKNKNKWISVKDALPEINKKVFFLMDNIEYPDNCWTGVYYGNDIWHKSNNLVQSHGITHWMLIPKKPIKQN
jgi:hypothetical protein